MYTTVECLKDSMLEIILLSFLLFQLYFQNLNLNLRKNMNFFFGKHMIKLNKCYIPFNVL